MFLQVAQQRIVGGVLSAPGVKGVVFPVIRLGRR